MLLLRLFSFCFSLLLLLFRELPIRTIWKILKQEFRSINTVLLHHEDVLSYDFWRVKFGEKWEAINHQPISHSILWSFWYRINNDGRHNAHFLQISSIQNISNR